MTAPQSAPADFIVFSDDWGEHPSSSQHLFRRLLAAGHRVLWVNTIGMRAPTISLADARKIVLKMSKMFRRSRGGGPARDSFENLHVVQPFMLPFSNIGLVRWLNRRSVLGSVRQLAQQHGLRQPIVVSTVPNACDFVAELGARRVVYYCVDDFAQWPGLNHELVRKMECDLIDKSDVLIATSEKLYQRLEHHGKPTHLLTHGVDIEHFSTQAPPSPRLARLSRPRALYFGLLDARTNQDLLVEVASRARDWSFVFVGPVEGDAGRLQRLSNVHLLGPASYAELPAFVSGSDVLILPYVLNELTAAISPLKLKEYMATGKPIISTPLPEVVKMGACVMLGRETEEWVAGLALALQADIAERRKRSRMWLVGESWGDKAREFEMACRS